jgi:cation transport regulator ChaB
VRKHLPARAQDIFRETFNAAWHTYGGTNPAHIEEIAHRWRGATVKKRYRKLGDVACSATVRRMLTIEPIYWGTSQAGAK